jgi:hypothetical protein
MIHSVWKPIFLKGKVNQYELVEKKSIIDMRGKTNYKVIWTCDNDKCNYPKQIHSISAYHLKKEKMCYKTQICRPCQCTGEGNGRYGDKRTWDELHTPQKVKELKKFMSDKWKGEENPSKLDEVKIKKNQTIITKNLLKNIVEEKKFYLIDVIELCGKKSKIKVKCDNGHIMEKRYDNFIRKDKKFICERCYYESISLNLTDEELIKIENYKRQVRALTAKNYKLYKDYINPKKLKIGKKDYHLDHKYSIYEGYRNNVDINIISAKENLEVIPYNENLSKQQRCSITLDELIQQTKYLCKNNNYDDQ